VERSWRPPIRFLVAGHLSDRKNPGAALEAFSALLEEHGPGRFDSELHLKVLDRANPFLNRPGRPHENALLLESMHPFAQELARIVHGRKRVFLHAGTWSTAALRRLYTRMHCLLAPSRGEGKNLMALEFMATGGTVIATDFGGHSVWLDESYSYPLRYRLRPAVWSPSIPDAQEAEPDVEHLKQLMWRVFEDPQEARAKGQLASAVIPSKCDWDLVLGRLLDTLGAAGIADLDA
jgi:glycosyltransferase involved in cell wall biosynthesis